MNTNFFNNINGYSLDEQQRNAILNAAKYSLIIAGAGSGKTLTMVGKIKYLIEIKKIKPEEILCISFTNESTKSLKEKIKNPNVNVFTFHKLAIDILKKEDIYYEIIPENYLSNLIKQFFNKEVWSNIFLKKQYQKLNKTIFLTKSAYKNHLQSKKHKAFIKIIENFISLYSTNNLTKEDFKKFFKTKKNNPLLFLIYAILTLYENKKAENNYYDFDDLIKNAIQICNKKKICFYKEIIVDEFQDTSILRLDLIKSVVKNNDSNLTVVGDDFQSIYKFSGCNLNIFLNFQKYFKGAKTFKIENTYRNSQELINVAGDFIMQNKNQIHKNLKSQKHIEKSIKIVKYINKYTTILKVIKKINTGEILILGRNNFDIYSFIPKEKINWKKNGYFKLENYDYNLRYLTIHKSKGLESDHIIIINLENKELGFPSLKKNNPINYLIEEKENFIYEEERRLFYVALTRTKNECFLLIPYINASIFIKEIKKYKSYIEYL